MVLTSKNPLLVSVPKVDKQWNDVVPLARFLLKHPVKKGMGTLIDNFKLGMDFSKTIRLANDGEKCDFILFPIPFSRLPDYEYHDALLDETIRLANFHHTPVLLEDFTEDVTDSCHIKFPIDGYVYLNPCLLKSCKPVHALALPYFIPDCREAYLNEKPMYLSKSLQPTVGFCGVAAPFQTPWSKTRIWDYLRLWSTYLSCFGLDPEKILRCFGTNSKHAYRARLIHSFSSDRRIQCDVKLREVGGLVDNSYTNLPDNSHYKIHFYSNLSDNLYNICCRGTENYSVRFYETFCMGRIPIVVDTDLVLPFDDRIDYSKHCVWIDKKDVGQASEILIAYHTNLSEDECVAIQKANRHIWETYFKHDAYYSALIGSKV